MAGANRMPPSQSMRSRLAARIEPGSQIARIVVTIVSTPETTKIQCQPAN